MIKLVICGAINWDISCFVEHLPEPGEEVIVEQITRVSGGTGGNMAVAAARILGHEQVALIGALGEDEIAPKQVSTLQSEGVITIGINYLPGEDSGQAYILVGQDGQNVIASCLGANAMLSMEHLNNPSVERLLQECQYIVITDPPLDVVKGLINLAKRREIPVLWDPGILVSAGWEELKPLAMLTDVFLLNEAEAAALLGTVQLDLVMRKLQRLESPNHVVLKLGAQGAAVLEPHTGTVIEVPALPLKNLDRKVISTVGCGDVFGGVFAAYYVLKASLQESLIMATTAAGLNATQIESRGSPERETLEAIEKRSRHFGFAVREYRLSKGC